MGKENDSPVKLIDFGTAKVSKVVRMNILPWLGLFSRADFFLLGIGYEGHRFERT